MCVPLAVILPPGGNISASGDNICTKAIQFTLQAVILSPGGNISESGNDMSAQAVILSPNGNISTSVDNISALLKTEVCG